MSGVVRFKFMLNSSFGGVDFFRMQDVPRDKIYERITQYPNLTRLEMNGCGLKDGDINKIISLLPDNPILSELEISDNDFSAQAIDSLISAAKEHTAFNKIKLGKVGLNGRAGGEALARLIENCPRLEELDISGNNLGDEGMAAVGEALRNHQSLQVLTATHVDISKKGVEQLVKDVEQYPDLCVLKMTDQDIVTKSELARLSGIDALIGGECKNMVLCAPLNDALVEFCRNNQHKTREAAGHMEQEPSTLDYDALAAINTRWPAINQMWDHFKPPLDDSNRSLNTMYNDYVAFNNALPRIDENAPAEALFAPNEQGYAPLDNPETWKNPQKVIDMVTAKGQALTAEFMQRSTPRGVTFEGSAIKAAPLSKLIPALNKAGIQLREDKLLQANGEPTALYAGIIERGDGAQLFTRANMRGCDSQTMRRMASALPEAQRNRAPLHQLAAALDMETRNTAKGR